MIDLKAAPGGTAGSLAGEESFALALVPVEPAAQQCQQHCTQHKRLQADVFMGWPGLQYVNASPFHSAVVFPQGPSPRPRGSQDRCLGDARMMVLFHSGPGPIPMSPFHMVEVPEVEEDGSSVPNETTFQCLQLPRSYHAPRQLPHPCDLKGAWLLHPLSLGKQTFAGTEYSVVKVR